ncbi:unnamed protein product, partial [Mesorhabditis belari]|uniref:Uncharacterized protein n=1 Tax=Mesorhabditis belari TaxID=2138241 RepID=A0AAF3EFT7_9BILA
MISTLLKRSDFLKKKLLKMLLHLSICKPKKSYSRLKLVSRQCLSNICHFCANFVPNSRDRFKLLRMSPFRRIKLAMQKVIFF